MGEDLSSGVKVGVILIILCSIIGTVMSLMAVVKNVTRTGAMQLQSSLEAMDRMYEDNFNQKTVTGNEVISAIQLNQGSAIAIVVAEPKEDNKLTLHNYGALLGAISTGAADGITVGNVQVGDSKYLYYDDKTQSYIADLFKVGTEVQYNYKITNIYKNTEREYVNPNYKYESKLIRDISGTTIGYFFMHTY